MHHSEFLQPHSALVLLPAQKQSYISSAQIHVCAPPQHKTVSPLSLVCSSSLARAS